MVVCICLSGCKQVLAESEQMRKETEDIGPLAELEHWKHRMAKFVSLLEEIRCQECRIVLSVLAGAKSKVVKVSGLSCCGLRAT